MRATISANVPDVTGDRGVRERSQVVDKPVEASAAYKASLSSSRRPFAGRRVR